MKRLALVAVLSGIALAQPKVEVKNPWVREVPPTSTMSAAFMTIKNTGKEEDSLVGAETKVSKYVELHQTVKEGEVMKMVKVDRIKVPAGSSVRLEPSGLHIMLIDLQKPLKAGEKVELVLHFEKSGKVKVVAPVKASRTEHHHH